MGARDSSTGTLGSIRCNCHRSILLVRRRRRLISTSWAKYSGTAHRQPLVWTLPGQARLGCDNQARFEGRQGFANQILADVRPVAVSGVDEVHTQFHGAFQYAFGFFGIFRVAPDAFAGDAHGAKSQPVNFQIAAKFECLCDRHFVPRQELPKSNYS